MKKLLYLLTLSMLLLTACKGGGDPSTSNVDTSSTSNTSQTSMTSNTSVSPSSSLTSVGPSIGPSTSQTSNTSYSTSVTSVPPPVSWPVNLDLYSVNDYHGAVSRRNVDYYYEGGVSRFATYLKDRMSDNPNGSIFVNAGDLWQDTYDSAMNRGELLTKAMVDLGCEAMALGNHEFDWGQETIIHNKQVAETYNASHQMTFLGANIYHYEDGAATTQASELCSPYKIIHREGLRIGLIGGIGTKQITSITSNNWTNLIFTDPVEITKTLSDYLRTVMNCDLILYLYHGGVEDNVHTPLSEVSPVSGKHYVDAGFLGHTHYFEDAMVDGVPWIQSFQHGSALGHIALSVSEDGSVECTYQSKYENKTENGYGNGANSIYNASEDASMNALVNSYLTTDFVNAKNATAATFLNPSGDTIGSEAGRMQAYMTSELIDNLPDSLGIPDVDVIINNGNRSTVNLRAGNTLTNEDVFNLLPFTNKTIIARVQGRDIKTECLSYSNPYYLPGGALTLDNDEYYTVACIDYMLLHKGTYRTYNYFPSYDDNPYYVIESFPYEIVCNYFNSHANFDLNTLSGTNFTGLS